MIKVHTIYGNFLSNSIGPSQTIRRMLSFKERFLKDQFDYSVYSLDLENEELSNLKSERGNNLGTWRRFKENEIIKYLEAHTFILASLSIYFKYLRYSLKIKRKISTLEFYADDIIVFHEPITYLVLRKRIEEKGLKALLFYHSDNFEDDMFFNYYPILSKYFIVKRALERFKFKSLNTLKAIVFINSSSYHRASQQYPRLKDKFKLVQNGIEDLYIKVNTNTSKVYKNNTLKLVTIGTVNARKNQIFLIKVINQIKNRLNYNLHLTVVGDGPDFRSLVKYCSENSLYNLISLEGNQENVMEYLSDAHVFISASTNEGLPIAIVEAMSMGLPIITSDFAGFDGCVINNFNGLVYSQNNEEELSKLLLNFPFDRLKYLGNNSRELFLQKFQFESMYKQYVGVLNEMK